MSSLNQRRRHGVVTRQSLYLSFSSLFLLAFLSLYSSNHSSTLSSTSYNNSNVNGSHSYQQQHQHRGLKYNDYSCEDIWDFTEEPENGESRSDSDRCLFSKECNNGEGLYLSGLFCSDRYSYRQYAWLVCPPLALFLITLFRALGSTAEDYFSPSLEMFSSELGLPPRFAGVSLLALGNGSADVSATMNAITSDPTNGYQMSLGALTGAGMFISTVVAAVVIIANEGVKCRGALVRDTSMYIIAVVVVYSFLQRGIVDTFAITFFIALYGAFVLIVLCADVYHRTIVLPRSSANTGRNDDINDHVEVESSSVQLEDEEVNVQNSSLLPPGVDQTEASIEGISSKTQSKRELEHSTDSTNLSGSQSLQDSSVFGGILSALSNYNDGNEAEDISSDELVKLHGSGGLVTDKHRHRKIAENSEEGTSYRAMLEMEVLDPCAGSINALSAYNWKSAFFEAKDDFISHVDKCRCDIYENDENSFLDKFLLSLELPFIILRKLTVSVPAEGFYCRPVVALSIMFSPAWLAFYLSYSHDIDLISQGRISFLSVMLVISTFLGILVVRYGPAGEGPMSLGAAGPIALWGFIVAATWIDAIADQLVDVLSLFGVILKIPGSILGITILAWGNSMGDLAANAAMARKGLANMAITACYAGPIFNMLIGLGAGFSALASQTGEVEKEVELTPSIDNGFIFLIINCLMVIVTGTVITQGRIPPRFGYYAGTLYMIYLVVSLTLHFEGLD